MCLSLDQFPDQVPPPALLGRVHLLSSLLSSLDTKAALTVAKLIETWCTHEMPERDILAATSLPFLVGASLLEDASKADVKRVWSVHQGVLSLPPAPSHLPLLASTIASKLYLSCQEGLRWLAFLFTVSPDLVGLLHRSARTVIPNLAKPSLIALGEVYHKAWHVSGGEFRRLIENDCIQDLLYRCLVAPRSLSAPLLRFLGVLFAKKANSIPTDAMLTRLLEPILWRHLKVPNEVVRLNACDILMAAYPLDITSLPSIQEREAFISKQHQAMQDLLLDASANVRTGAVTGVCSIMADLWLLIPSEVINSLVKVVVKQLACDSASARVRQAAVKGATKLLSTPNSHVYLRKVLPRLADRLHDSSEAVRGEMLNLLLAVKRVRSINYWDVVSLDSLLARLEVDKPFIRRRIVKLLHNSFCPSNVDDEQFLQRCINLVSTSRPASRRFYQDADLTLQDASRLILAVLASVRQWVKSLPEEEVGNASGGGRRKLYNSMVDDTMSTTASSVSSLVPDVMATSEDQKEGRNGVEEEDVEHPYSNPEVVWGVLDVVCVLWTRHNVEMSKDENIEMRSALEKKAGKCLMVLFRHFRASPASGTIVYLASFLPDRLVAPLASYSMAKVRGGEEYWQGCADSLCNWRRGGELLEVVLESLKAGLTQARAGKGGTENKGVRFQSKGVEEEIGLGVRLLAYLVSHNINRTALLMKEKEKLGEVAEVCLSVTSVVEERLCQESLTLEEGALLAQVPELGVQLSVLLGNPVANLEELLTWTEAELLRVTSGDTDMQHTRAQVSLAERCLSNTCTLASSCLAIGSADVEFTDKLVDWSLELVQRGGEGQLGGVLRLLQEATSRAAVGSKEAWLELYIEKVLVTFAKVLSWLDSAAETIEAGGEVASELKKEVTGLLKLYAKKGLGELGEQCLEDLVEVIVVMVTKQVAEKVNQTREVEVVTVPDQLGAVAGALLQAVVAAGAGNLLAKQLEERLVDGEEVEEEVVATVAAAVYIINSVLNLKRKAEVNQAVEDFVGMKVMLHDIQGQDKRSKEGRRRSCCCLVYLDTLTRTLHFKLLFFWPRIRTSYNRNISGGLLCAASSFDSHHYQCCLLLPACSNICFSHSAGLCAPSSDTCRMWQRTFGYLPYIFNILLHIRLPAVPAEYSIQNEISR